MTWFGTVSAWGAVLVGLAFGALTAMSFDLQSPAVPLINAVSALLLLMAAFRTLRKMSGGLRLLCGAWGLIAGLSIERLFAFSELNVWSGIVLAFALISAAGLALTVLHKETK
jgi:hypothetical protein